MTHRPDNVGTWGNSNVSVLYCHGTTQVLAFMSDGYELTGDVLIAGGSPHWPMHVERRQPPFTLPGKHEVSACSASNTPGKFAP